MGLPPELENCHLDHIAIAVKGLDSSQKIFEDLGLSFSAHREEIPDQGVRVAFASIDTTARLELLEPLQEGQGPIGKFIQKKGEGIHHLCFRVPDVKKKSEELTQKGYQLLYPEPVQGAGGHLVNFIHPKSTGGVLIELSQESRP